MSRLLLLLLVSFGCINAQDPSRFIDEVGALTRKYDSLWDPSRETVVFTGSSSIRFWQNLPELFPDHQIVNTGFGGSQTSDLLVYAQDLILRYQPKQVFIYEGDNDINDLEKPRHILRETKNLIGLIREGNPKANIVIISAKPSLLRWHLHKDYKKLNRKFKRLCRRHGYLEFADVWAVMLEGETVRKDLFIEDGLHMNEKGYQLWYEQLKNYIN